MYLLVADGIRIVLKRAGLEIGDLLSFRVHLTLAVDTEGVIGVVLLVETGVAFQYRLYELDLERFDFLFGAAGFRFCFELISKPRRASSLVCRCLAYNSE
jgi:hypothetical protein